MGRPLASESERRHRINLRLNDDEHEALEKARNEQGMSISEYLRHALKEAAYGQKKE